MKQSQPWVRRKNRSDKISFRFGKQKQLRFKMQRKRTRVSILGNRKILSRSETKWQLCVVLTRCLCLRGHWVRQVKNSPWSDFSNPTRKTSYATQRTIREEWKVFKSQLKMPSARSKPPNHQQKSFCKPAPKTQPPPS